MSKGRSYIAYGAIALVILCFALAAGYLDNKVPALTERKSPALNARASEQQAVAQRRGAIGTAALADTTVQ